jgi:uncharacterized protein YpiB (UPF0302 family)
MPDGTMQWELQDFRLSGHNCKTYVINYHFSHGILKNNVHYSGTSRTAYLP